MMYDHYSIEAPLESSGYSAMDRWTDDFHKRLAEFNVIRTPSNAHLIDAWQRRMEEKIAQFKELEERRKVLDGSVNKWREDVKRFYELLPFGNQLA